MLYLLCLIFDVSHAVEVLVIVLCLLAFYKIWFLWTKLYGVIIIIIIITAQQHTSVRGAKSLMSIYRCTPAVKHLVEHILYYVCVAVPASQRPCDYIMPPFNTGPYASYYVPGTADSEVWNLRQSQVEKQKKISVSMIGRIIPKKYRQTWHMIWRRFGIRPYLGVPQGLVVCGTDFSWHFEA